MDRLIPFALWWNMRRMEIYFRSSMRLNSKINEIKKILCWKHPLTKDLYQMSKKKLVSLASGKLKAMRKQHKIMIMISKTMILYCQSSWILLRNTPPQRNNNLKLSWTLKRIKIAKLLPILIPWENPIRSIEVLLANNRTITAIE